MANTILHKRGTTTPGTGSLTVGELAINTATGQLYTKKDDTTVVEIGAGGAASTHLTFNAQVGTSYTLVIGDDGELVSMTNAAANTLTVPPNSSVAFPVGTQILVSQEGAGQTTMVAGVGVTLLSAGSLLALASQYSTLTLIKKATDTWLVAGDLA